MKLLRQPRKVALLCLLFLLFWSIFWAIRANTSTTTISGSFTLYPEDTLIDKELPNTQVWENVSSFQLGNSTTYGHEHRGYFKFNLSAEYRGVINITLAQVMLYFSNLDMGSVGNEIRLYDTNNESWFDHNITWNNAPPLQYIELYDSLHSDLSEWYSFFISDSGNASYGVGGLQNNYDLNSSRTFVLAFPDFPALMEWSSNESTSYRPFLVVYYDQTFTSEDTTPRPTINHPTAYDLKFFAIDDAIAESWNITENRGSENESQVEAIVSSGYVSTLYLKFNLSYPDRINDLSNTANFSLRNMNWIADTLIFKAYCSFAPESPNFRGYYSTEGLLRSSENSWNETSLTWSNKPSTRGYTSLAVWMDSTGYKTWDLSAEEDYIRFTNQNGTTYTIVLEVDQRQSRNSFANFITSEGSLSVPYVEMSITTEPFAFAQSEALNFYNAKDYLAYSWSLSPFIAGHLLCAMIYCVTVIPIGWIGRKGKKDFVLVLMMVVSVVELSAFVLFTWLNAGIFIILLIVLVLFCAGALTN
jgi:hypothetical protein